jgi:hypothetical protein
MTTKADLHRLIDALPDELAAAAGERLAELEDPVLRALLLAPVDDELEGEEEGARIAEARADLERGDVLPWEQVRVTLR